MSIDGGSGFGEALVAVVEQVERSVLRIEGGRGVRASGFGWSVDGLVVTSARVVEAADEEVRVGVGSDDAREAQLVGLDPGSDVALLRVDEQRFEPLRFADVESLRVGRPMVALARPGRGIRASFRIIGLLGPEMRTSAGGKLDRYVETDAPLPRGFSGGLLVGLDGLAIGMNTIHLIDGADLCVPHVTLERVVAALLAHGTVARGYLGLGLQPVRLSAETRQLRGQATGLLVVAVEESSPASRAGLLLGDVLLRAEDTALAELRELHAVLLGPAGRNIKLGLLRAGQPLELEVTLGARPDRSCC